MSTLNKFAVLSMLAVMIIAFCTPVSAQVGLGAATTAATTAAATTTAATSVAAGGFGAFGGFGFPFNWGFVPFGVGAFPYNWGLGAGLGPFGLGWNQFTPCFGGLCGGSFFTPCFGAGACLAGLPFIMGGPFGSIPGFGFGVSPWAFGLGGCTQAAPLFFGAHGFGFPFTIGSLGCSLNPCVCAGLPFIMGGPFGSIPGFGFGVSPWAFGLGGCTQAAPLFFGAHGFGFPFTIGSLGCSFAPIL